MNNRRLISPLVRLYSSKSFSKSTCIQGRSTFGKTIEDIEDEAFNNDDMNAYESDFMNVGKSYTMYQREVQKSKEKLKQRIVKNKYFKEEEPKFLTFTEKDQIQKLHESNPEEWTPERLSESFPALPETIRRVLRSKWVPKSVDRIIRYDSAVIENWKNFKTGKLIVNPMLYEHLMKFKDRKITLSSREALSEFIPPKMQFPKPKSTVFSNIVKEFIDKKQPVYDQKSITSKNIMNENNEILNTVNNNNIEKSVVPVRNSSIIQNAKPKLNASDKALPYNEFMKEQLKQLYNTSPEEGIILLQTYRKYIESNNSVTTDSNASNNTVEKVNEQNSTVLPRNTLTENVSVVKREDTKSRITSPQNIERNCSLDTFIKDRKVYIDTKNDYVKPIKIPKNIWKHGMTYRVQDCYYDYDGEFLYRVPGLLT